MSLNYTHAYSFYRVTEYKRLIITGTSLATHHSIDGQELVSSLKPTMPLSHAPRDDA